MLLKRVELVGRVTELEPEETVFSKKGEAFICAMAFLPGGILCLESSRRSGAQYACERRSRIVRWGSKPVDDLHVEKAISAIKVGELVIHDKYGIGRFLGVDTSTTGEDFAVLDYRDGDLLVPMSQLDRLSRVTKSQF
uniref:CarD-like/TRCF RNAP-interacting domain-containing protein n=1 Tax=Rhodosorus marinus TaxID=101924 RepID=A0A7S0G7R6_9RHOD|mmetsp:Transcript_6445/g.9197  ORF Transcript_6445/g.9197 Transcript_6445/m.9197 type:complete len:138 (+) Transcript_6445:928-1341(+)